MKIKNESEKSEEDRCVASLKLYISVTLKFFLMSSVPPASVPPAYRCGISGRVMLDPCSFVTKNNGDMTVDRVAVEKAHQVGYFVINDKLIKEDRSDAWFGNEDLKSEIESFLAKGGYSDPVLVNWLLSPGFRLKVYIEFQQILEPKSEYKDLGTMNEPNKILTKQCIEDVLKRSNPKEFKEDIDIVEEALRKFAAERNRDFFARVNERRARWPKIFPSAYESNEFKYFHGR